jgi:hypothetical protein
MKNVTRILALAALMAATVEVQTSSSTLPSQGPYELRRIPSSAVHHQHSARPRLRLWDSTSGNWSGYAVPLDTSGVSDTFSQVQGTWKVPTVTGGRSAAYLATWVGLDGYTSGTVEQTGTEQDWTGRGQQNYAWFEMYPNGSYEIEGFPVDPGDSISAQVLYVGQTTVTVGRGRSTQTEQESVFQLTIKNNTRNVSYTVPASYTTIPTPSRSSAEWIAEAPSSNRGILPLDDFGTVNFSSCYATGLAGAVEPLTSWPDDPLTMINPNGGEALPSVITGTAFSVAWAQ